MERTALDAVLRWKAAAAAEDQAKARAAEAIANEAKRTIGLEWVPDHPSSGIACRSGRFRLGMTDKARLWAQRARVLGAADKEE